MPEACGEDRGEPSLVDTIAGRVPRHSRAFYRWRVQWIEQQAAQERAAPGDFDDLAVAYFRLGRRELALHTLERKDEVKPGHYRTEALRALFFMEMNQLDRALRHAELAIERNPNVLYGDAG